MKSFRAQDPVRWLDAEAEAEVGEAGTLAEAASAVPSLGAPALARIRAEVAARRTVRRGSFLRGLPMRSRVAFAIVLVLLCVTTVGGATVLWRHYAGVKVTSKNGTSPPVDRTLPSVARRNARASSAQDEPQPVSPPAPDREVAPPASQDVEVPPPSLLQRSKAAAVHSADAKRAEATVVPPRQPMAPPLPDSLPSVVESHTPLAKVTEASLIAEALSALRREHDPRAALATLDRHAQAFPHGVLAREALRTRAEAVIQLGDLTTALALLDGTPALAEVLGVDLLLTRAELRAAVGRFREALVDFTEVVNQATGLPVGGDERALYGRAVCLGRLAQRDHARAGLRLYQTRFPHGRFAAEAARLLADPIPSERP